MLCFVASLHLFHVKFPLYAVSLHVPSNLWMLNSPSDEVWHVYRLPRSFAWIIIRVWSPLLILLKLIHLDLTIPLKDIKPFAKTTLLLSASIGKDTLFPDTIVWISLFTKSFRSLWKLYLYQNLQYSLHSPHFHNLYMRYNLTPNLKAPLQVE